MKTTSPGARLCGVVVVISAVVPASVAPPVIAIVGRRLFGLITQLTGTLFRPS
jgi:hypothetical protein